MLVESLDSLIQEVSPIAKTMQQFLGAITLVALLDAWKTMPKVSVLLNALILEALS